MIHVRVEAEKNIRSAAASNLSKALVDFALRTAFAVKTLVCNAKDFTSADSIMIR